MERIPVSMEIEDIALPKGWGVARQENQVFFIPGGLPGDRVGVRITREKSSYAYGEITRIEQSSPFRVTPECPHFGVCGGCLLQNFSYEKQLELKKNYLIHTLQTMGGIPVEKAEILPVTASPDRYFYRNKMEYAFGEKNGKIILGLRERVSPLTRYQARVTPLDRCLIFSPVVERVFPLFINFANRYNFPAYNPMTKKGFLRHLVIRDSKNTGELMIVLVTTRGIIPDFTSLVEELTCVVPEMKSFYWVINNQISDVVSFGQKDLVFGQASIEEKMGGFRFLIHPQTFFQTNPKTAGLLYATLADLTSQTHPERILGLYCGTGPLEIFLSRVSQEVMGIDSEPANIAGCLENCQLNGIKNCVFQQGRVEKLREISLPEINFLVLDPPRAGLTPKALKLIVNLDIPAVAYVSCNPATLARDLKFLQEAGYQVKTLAPFDFFPHTGHLETLCLLKKM